MKSNITLKRLTKKYIDELKVINQPVFIRDIFVFNETIDETNSFTHGETYIKSSKYTDIPRYTRLTDHIRLLANIAARTHEQYYCQQLPIGSSNFVIKENSKNCITRISTSEFSFYTDQPLTLDKLAIFIEILEILGKDYHPNIHLLLSSFAVITDDMTLLNVCLYVQCGPEPVITCFSKAQASHFDIAFDNAKLFQQRELTSTQQPSSFTAKMDSHKGLVISHESIINVVTLGGARFTVAIDICLDYFLEQSKKLLTEELKSPSLNTRLFPHQIDHIVTANSINLYTDKNIVQSTKLVDPKFSKIYMSAPSKDTEFLEDAKLYLPSQYKKEDTYLLRLCTTGQLILFNPPFGHSTYVTLHHERKLECPSSPLQKLIYDFNYNNLVNLANNVDQSNSPGYLLLRKKYSRCIEFTDYLKAITKLSQSTEGHSSFFGKSLPSTMIDSFVNQFIETIPPMNLDHETFIEKFNLILDDFKNNLKKILISYRSNYFTNSIVKKIEETQSILSLKTEETQSISSLENDYPAINYWLS